MPVLLGLLSPLHGALDSDPKAHGGLRLAEHEEVPISLSEVRGNVLDRETPPRERLEPLPALLVIPKLPAPLHAHPAQGSSHGLEPVGPKDGGGMCEHIFPIDRPKDGETDAPLSRGLISDPIPPRLEKSEGAGAREAITGEGSSTPTADVPVPTRNETFLEDAGFPHDDTLPRCHKGGFRYLLGIARQEPGNLLLLGFLSLLPPRLKERDAKVSLKVTQPLYYELPHLAVL